jgi:hypothetical protein
MNIDDWSFHDSVILEVIENTKELSIEILLDFPVDWGNNVFEKRTLKFNGVVTYQVNEIPFVGQQTILNIIKLELNERKLDSQSIQIQTNAGNRLIEFDKCELI